jgi:hypothetical protein
VERPEEGAAAVDGDGREDAAPVQVRRAGERQARARGVDEPAVEDDLRVHLGRRIHEGPFGGEDFPGRFAAGAPRRL